MTYGYIRVSTDRQTVENQRFEITRFCSSQGLSIDGWIEETISGMKNYDKRKLGHLLERVQSGDIIICAELSRLGRSLFMIMEILSLCMQKGCVVWTIKDGYRLGEDIQSKVLAFCLWAVGGDRARPHQPAHQRGVRPQAGGGGEAGPPGGSAEQAGEADGQGGRDPSAPGGGHQLGADRPAVSRRPLYSGAIFQNERFMEDLPA